MEKLINLLKKIFDIPEQYAYPIAMIGFVFLYLALKGLEIMEIVGYPLSSYGFIVLIVALTKRIPKIVQFVLDSRIWKKIEELPLVGLLLKDTVIRMRFFLYFGTLMNLLYVILKIGGGILFHSLWLSFMGGYYLACGRV